MRSETAETETSSLNEVRDGNRKSVVSLKFNVGFSFYCCCKLFSFSPSTTLDPCFLMDSLTSQTFIVKQFGPPSCSLLRTLTDALVKPCMCLKRATETLCGLEES